MNIASLRIEQLVVHNVPQGSDEFEELTLTDSPIELDDELRRYFEDKTKISLRERGLQIVADPAASSIVRDGVAAIIADDSALVSSSQQFAEHLNEIQTRRNPPGLLVVATASVDDAGRVIAVLKLEREQGLHFTITDVGGRRVVDLEFLRRLTLTGKTRIFKTAVVQLSRPQNVLSLYGAASDDQRGRDE